MNIYTTLVIMVCLIYSSMANISMKTRPKQTYAYNVFYWDVPPLIKSSRNNGDVFGIIPDILKEIESRCYGSSNENTTTFVNYTRMSSEQELFATMSKHPKESLQGTVWGPFLTHYLNSDEVTNFCAQNNIIPKKLVGIEGMAVVVPKRRLYILHKVVSGLLQLIKMYSLFLITCIISGLLFWLVDQSRDPETASLKGIISCIWWAFITMTTVGYGDVIPKTKLGRIFAVLWMYYAMIVFCIVTGIVTTLVFSDELFDISDKDVAVLDHSYEADIGDNTFSIKPLRFDTYDEVLDAVRNDDKVFAGLVPGSIAAWRQDEIKDLGLSVVAIHQLSMYSFFLELNDGHHDTNRTKFNQLQKSCHQYSYDYIYKLTVKDNYERLLEAKVYLIHPFKDIFKFEHVYVTIIIVLVLGCAIVLVGTLKDKVFKNKTKK